MQDVAMYYQLKKKKKKEKKNVEEFTDGKSFYMNT